MPRTRSTAVKEEPLDDETASMNTPTFHNATLKATQQNLSHRYSIDSIVNPVEHFDPSSSSTVHNDDIDMIDGRNGTSTTVSENETNGTSTTSNFADLPRKLIKAIQRLESLSIDATLPSLPKIVVVGDQSHGKSSIIEAVCDISLPRSEGTCTRCPFQLVTTGCTTEPWSCKISLIRQYSYNSKSVPGNRYPHWDDTGHQNAVEFAHLTGKSQLEHALRLAQVAILNPQMNPADVLHANNPEMATKVNFSPNRIHLEISSEELPELSLLDTPGVIAVAENSYEQHLVGMIEKMIKNYVKDEKALILLAVAASADTDTSSAFKIVNNSKALDRCVGVLTKPDLITKSRQQIKRILNDEIFKLGNQWYVTKLMSQEQLDAGVPHSEARVREQTFFATQEPWCTTLAEFSERFGIPHLQESLSNKLTEHILSQIPEISSRVTRRLQQIDDQLDKFPEQVKAPCLTVITEIEKVGSVIAAHIRGEDIENEFRTAYRKIMRNLRKQLQGAKPQLILVSPGFKAPPIEIESDNETSPDPSPTKARKINDGRAITTSTQAHASPAPRIKSEEDAPAAAPVKTVFTLENLKRAYDSGTTGGLPDQTNPKATEHLVLQCLRGWRGMVTNALEDVKHLMVNMLSKSIETTLASRRETQFFCDTTQIVETLFLELLQKQHDLIDTIVAAEMHKPITYADDALKLGRESARERLKSDRESQRVNEFFDKLDSRSHKPTKQEDRTKKTADVLSKLGPDPYHREITAMATPLAYYDIAAHRILDDIAKHLEFGLMYALETGVKERLIQDLRAMDSQHCVQLLAEDPRREEQRRRLISEKERLEKAMDELRGLPNQR